MNEAHEPRNKCVRPSAVFACCLLLLPLAFQVRCRVPVGGVGGGGGGGSAQGEARVLLNAGPQFPAVFALSDITARVLLREAPMVVEYRLGAASTATVTLTVQANNRAESFERRLDQTGGQITQVSFRLPASFGREPRPGTFSVKAVNVDPANAEPPDFELTGVCMGERACGSIGLEDVSLRPDRVRASQKEQALYGFRSLADFARAEVQFSVRERVGRNIDNRVVSSQRVGGLSRGETVSKRWNCKNRRGLVSKGPHSVAVEAWNNEQGKGDWTRAGSRKAVIIE